MLGSFVFKSVFTVGSLSIHILFSEIVTMFLTGNMIGWVVGGCVLLICARQNVCTDGLGWDRLLAKHGLFRTKKRPGRFLLRALGLTACLTDLQQRQSWLSLCGPSGPTCKLRWLPARQQGRLRWLRPLPLRLLLRLRESRSTW